MKIKLLSSLVLAAVMATGCSNKNTSDTASQAQTEYLYAGNYEILSDGSCEQITQSDNPTNMRLSIEKVEGENAYIGSIINFENTAIPHVSNKAQPSTDGLKLFFDKSSAPEEGLEVNVTVEMQPHETVAETLLVTKFNIYRKAAGTEENRDFVSWYISQLELPEEEKNKLLGLCAVKPKPAITEAN